MEKKPNRKYLQEFLKPWWIYVWISSAWNQGQFDAGVELLGIPIQE